MPRCPVCDSVRIVIVVNSERRAFCPECGSRWRQEGEHQWNITQGEYAALKATSSEEVSAEAPRP